MIEEFDAEKYNADMYLKILDVTTETSNSVHFLKKGISCGCLDEVHQKLFIEGNKRCVFCCNSSCKQRMKKRDAKLCKCGLAQYCSRHCQLEDWPEHKGPCKSIREAKEHLGVQIDSGKMDNKGKEET